MAQAVGTCVVASFTAKARHPEQKALVPTVLLDEKQFRVCLYELHKQTASHKRKIVKEWHGFTLVGKKPQVSSSNYTFTYLVPDQFSCRT